MALWLASLTPALAPPIQGLCLGGALVACGFAVAESRAGIRGAAIARVREGMNFEAVKQEIAIAAASLEQAMKAQYFPNDIEHPLSPREQLERAYQQSPDTLKVTPEVVRAVRLLLEAGYTREKVAEKVLRSDDVSGIDQVLEIGEKQGW
jgi:hypothetical protein